MPKLTTKTIAKVLVLAEDEGPYINHIQVDYDNEYKMWSANVSFTCTRGNETGAVRGLLDELKAFVAILEEAAKGKRLEALSAVEESLNNL